MAKTKFFTEQATAGSRGEASAEDMERGYIDIKDYEDTKLWGDEGDLWGFEPPGQGGFLGRVKGWER